MPKIEIDVSDECLDRLVLQALVDARDTLVSQTGPQEETAEWQKDYVLLMAYNTVLRDWSTPEEQEKLGL